MVCHSRTIRRLAEMAGGRGGFAFGTDFTCSICRKITGPALTPVKFPADSGCGKYIQNLTPVKSGPGENRYLLPMQGSIKTTENATAGRGLADRRAVAISEFADYQDGAVVSRELVRKPAGNVTFFAFDAGQGLSEHTAPFDALVQVVEGKVEIIIAGKSHQLCGGELILMPAGRPHALKALSRFKMILTMIRS